MKFKYYLVDRIQGEAPVSTNDEKVAKAAATDAGFCVINCETDEWLMDSTNTVPIQEPSDYNFNGTEANDHQDPSD